MKKQILILGLSLGVLAVVAQAVKENKEASNGNGVAMENNLNEPNAVVPPKNNNQEFDRGDGAVKSSHPENSTGNTYNSKCYADTKK